MCACRVAVSIFFFFSSRRRHTRLQGDWSSDVCSSDLNGEIDITIRGPWLHTILFEIPVLADRKSTRLNSSHLVISYAVFCLKKKKVYCRHFYFLWRSCSPFLCTRVYVHA